MSDTDTLLARFEAVVARLEELAPEVTPFALPPNVAAGELIESAWGNNVADTLAQHQGRLTAFQGSSVLVTTDASGAGVVNFLYPFASLPVIPVTQSFSTAAFGINYTIYAVNLNGFTFVATSSTGGIYPSLQVGIHWIAMSMV